MTEYDFQNDFMKVRPNQFSYNALQALWKHFEQYEEDTGEVLEFDPISICCDFTEYQDIKEIQENYPDITSMKDLERETKVISFEGGFVIQNY
jgi:hypothetical protein